MVPVMARTRFWMLFWLKIVMHIRNLVYMCSLVFVNYSSCSCSLVLVILLRFAQMLLLEVY